MTKLPFLLALGASVLALNGAAQTPPSEEKKAETSAPQPAPIIDTIQIEGGYEATLDTTETPDLTEWARQELIPMAKEWYPKLIPMLASEGFEAPRSFSIVFRKDMQGVANCSGTRIRCAGDWFRKNLKGEARGAVFHEIIHVIQQYGNARRNNPEAKRTPGWLVEGIPDYIRWFIYEPETRGAEITERNIERAKYDASYRITANFLNWVVTKHDKDLILHLNAAARQGKYDEEIWKTRTGLALPELGDAWKKAMEEKIAAAKAEKK